MAKQFRNPLGKAYAPTLLDTCPCGEQYDASEGNGPLGCRVEQGTIGGIEIELHICKCGRIVAISDSGDWGSDFWARDTREL